MAALQDETYNLERDVHNCEGRCDVDADEGFYLIRPSILNQMFTVRVGAQ